MNGITKASQQRPQSYINDFEISNKFQNIDNKSIFKTYNDIDIFEKQNKKTDKYSDDDGKISFKDKAKNFFKGVISPVTSMFSSPKNFLIGTAAIAGSSLLIAATGGAIAPVLVAAGVAGGAVQLAGGAAKALNAKTDDEAKAAWQSIGCGTGAVASSILGAKSALKSAGVEIEKMNAIKATVNCFKQSPKAMSDTFKMFKSGNISLVKNSFKSKDINPEEVNGKNLDKTQEIIPDKKNKIIQGEGEAIDLKNGIIDDGTGVIENLRFDIRKEPRGEKIKTTDVDLEFQEKLKSLGTIEEDGVIALKQSNGNTLKVNAYTEEINGKKVIHLYDNNNAYIADFYDGGIVTDRDFVYYLNTDDNGNILFGKKFNPEGFATQDLESFYSQKIQEPYNNNGQIELQYAIDIFPKNSKQISKPSGRITLSQPGYSISDACSIDFMDSNGIKWNIRVHSQNITSQNKNWILRISHVSEDSKKPVFLDIENFDFTGVAKKAGSETSHLSIAPFFSEQQAILNDGNNVSYLSFLSQKLNLNENQITGKIRNFAKNLSSKNYNTRDPLELIYKIQEELNLDSIEETLAAIFHYD